MKIEIRSDTVHIEGYVNAVGRDSRVIPDRRGGFIEQVEPGTFRRSLENGKPVEIRLNHGRVLGSTGDGVLSLYEDAIGLHASADIGDEEVADLARRGELRGWSFGFQNPIDEWEEGEPPRRKLKGFDLLEVSLIDRRMTPAYIGTSVEARGQENLLTEFRGEEEEPEVSRKKEPEYHPDYALKRKILNLKRSR